MRAGKISTSQLDLDIPDTDDFLALSELNPAMFAMPFSFLLLFFDLENLELFPNISNEGGGSHFLSSANKSTLPSTPFILSKLESP